MSEWDKKSGVDQKKAEAMQKGVQSNTPEWVKKASSFLSDKEPSNDAKYEALKRRSTSYGS